MSINEIEWLQAAIAEAEKPIETGDRIFGVFIIIVSVFMLFMLISHINGDTGFFTRKLSGVENFLLFGYWIAWIITASLDSVFGLRLASRLFDSFGGILFMAISSLYFLFAFPFDFSVFPMVLPESIRFLVTWITDGVAKGLLLVGGVGMLVAAVYSPIAYKLISWKRIFD